VKHCCWTECDYRLEYVHGNKTSSESHFLSIHEPNTEAAKCFRSIAVTPGSLNRSLLICTPYTRMTCPIIRLDSYIALDPADPCGESSRCIRRILACPSLIQDLIHPDWEQCLSSEHLSSFRSFSRGGSQHETLQSCSIGLAIRKWSRCLCECRRGKHTV